MRSPVAIALAAAIGLALSGCAARVAGEGSARQRLEQVGAQLRPSPAAPQLPTLRPDSPLETYLLYAVMNHPSVTAAYFEWRAAVEAIAPARTLPDPRLTFEADSPDMLMTLMPGLMFDFMTPGKRTAMGREAAAASEVAYRAYVGAVLRAAVETRKAWIDVAFANGAERLYQEGLVALGQARAVTGAEYSTGGGMPTLEVQLAMLTQVGRVRADLEVQAHRGDAARGRLKSALGLSPADGDPPWPQASLERSPSPPEEELWARVQAANPEVASMRAMVEMAIAAVEVARYTGTPDLALGLMADLKASPLMVRPTASLTLPVWRQKIAATAAAAEARREAASARLAAEELDVAAELAQLLHMVRESDRMIAYIDDIALPNLERVVSAAEAGYQVGMASAAMIPMTRFMALGMQLERLEALRQREQALADLSLTIAEVAPPGSPLLDDATATP